MNHSDLLQLPKVDLHRHLDGSVKPEVVLSLAKQFGVKLPTYSLDEFKQIYHICDDNTTGESMEINALFARFGWAIAVMRTPEGLREVARQQVHDLAEENIRFAELRFAPGYHSIYPAPFYKVEDYEQEPFRVMSLDEVVQNTLAGLDQGMQETGVQANLALCIPRECHETYGVRSALEIAKLAVKYQNQGVVALDLACNEFDHPPEIYADIFQRTVGTKIRRDPHAGEMGSDDYRLANIKTCLGGLIANGLGHAIPLWHDKALTEHVKFLKVRVERSPWENDAVKASDDDGTDYLLKQGVMISICSDDPVLMRRSLTEALEKAATTYSWTEADINKMIANGVNSAFYRDKNQENIVKGMFTQRGILL